MSGSTSLFISYRITAANLIPSIGFSETLEKGSLLSKEIACRINELVTRVIGNKPLALQQKTQVIGKERVSLPKAHSPLMKGLIFLFAVLLASGGVLASSACRKGDDSSTHSLAQGGVDLLSRDGIFSSVTPELFSDFSFSHSQEEVLTWRHIEDIDEVEPEPDLPVEMEISAIPTEQSALSSQTLAQSQATYAEANQLVKSGLALVKLEDYKKAIKQFRKAEVLYPKEHPNRAVALNNLCTVMLHLKNDNKAIEYCNEALEIKKKIYPKEHPTIAETLYDLGTAFFHLRDNNEASKYFEQALAIYEEALGEEHANVADTLNNLGIVSLNLKNDNKAAEYFQRALAIRENIYPKEHPSITDTRHRLCIARKNLGDRSKALGDHKKAIQCYEEALPVCSEGYKLVIFNNLGNSQKDLKNYKEAIGSFKKALAICPEGHPDRATIRGNLANTWNGFGGHNKDLGKYKKAIKCYEEALPIYPEWDPKRANVFNDLGVTWSLQADRDKASGDHDKALENYKKAVDYLKKALTIREKAYPKGHPSIAAIRDNLGKALVSLAEIVTLLAEISAVKKDS